MREEAKDDGEDGFDVVDVAGLFRDGRAVRVGAFVGGDGGVLVRCTDDCVSELSGVALNFLEKARIGICRISGGVSGVKQ